MKKDTAEIVFVFPPASGNPGAFRNHLGVSYLRAVLAGIGISTIQYLNERPGTIKEIAREILDYQPKIVGFTVYDPNFLLSVALSIAIKEQKPGVQVIFGGPNPTFIPARILEQYDTVDACVLGEAEETGLQIFPALLDSHCFPDDQAGVAFRRDNKIVCNPLPKLVGSGCQNTRSPLDSTPSPYLSGILTDGRTGVLSGRGCTYHCQYCVFATLGRKKLRVHSLDRVIAELEFIADQQKRTGERFIVDIQDDTFTLLPERARELCQMIADRNMGLFLACITRADMVDDELMRMMRDAGFISLAFGLESAVPSVLRATGKVRPPDWHDPDLQPERHFLKEVRKSLISAKKYGISAGVSIILGLPGETIEDAAATLRFVKSLPVDYYMHNFLQVFPGTPLWENHDRYGIKCMFNASGLPVTYEYAYDITQLRPRPKCSLEQDARTIKLLTTDTLYGCESGSTTGENIRTVVVHGKEISKDMAEWLGQIICVGGLIVQVYPVLKRKDESSILTRDQCSINEHRVPVRNYVQLLSKKQKNEDTEQWRFISSGIEIYQKHKPQLVTFWSAKDSAPLLEWLKGNPAKESLCEISDCLIQPDELNKILNDFGGKDINQFVRDKPIPPDYKYPGRWLYGKAPCLTMTRIEIDESGMVHCCRNSPPIGKTGDTREMMLERLLILFAETEQRRGCHSCQSIHCPRCPFPGMDDQTYCSIHKYHDNILNLINRIRVYSRLPFILSNQHD